tara:strand:- start:1819 stop:2949 length:1131 start_codon:yes stop_codon:yes gene_type:complete
LIDPANFFKSLRENGITFFSGVPDSLLKDFCAFITDNSTKKNHIIAANEGNALSIGVGYHLSSSEIPLIYMQNSGLGNVINPLLSIADRDVYSIPMILLIGWRGEPDVKDEPQHKKQGRITIDLLETMEVPFEILNSSTNPEEANKLIKKIIDISRKEKRPCALVVSKGTFSSYELKNKEIFDRPLSREKAIELSLKEFSDDDIVVSTTGVTSRELFELRQKFGQGHKNDFLTVGGMGHASQIALGIALDRKDKEIFCLDGDGAFLMHMGSIAINGSIRCSNFKHILFNNSAHDSVGGQPTVGGKVNFLDIAKSCGYKWTRRVSKEKDIIDSLRQLKDLDGPALLEIQVKPGFRKNLGRPTSSAKQNKELFMKSLK